MLYQEDEEHWEVPGGKVEEGESPTQTAVREAEEEIRVEPDLKKPFFSGEFEHESELYLWHGYLAKIPSEPKLQEENFSEKKWVDAKELDELDLAPNLRQILPALRKVLKSREE